jgi:hypothetical protein
MNVFDPALADLVRRRCRTRLSGSCQCWGGWWLHKSGSGACRVREARGPGVLWEFESALVSCGLGIRDEDEQKKHERVDQVHSWYRKCDFMTVTAKHSLKLGRQVLCL